MAGQDISKHRIKLALGGMRFDRDLDLDWQITPSIGIVAKDIERMGLALTSYKEPLEQSIKEVMMPSIRKNFDAGGRPEKWPPLAEYTLHVKGHSGVEGGDKPLIRTGALRRGASSFQIWDIGNTSATVRSLPDEIWYGAVHQSGYGGMGALISLARRQLGAGATQKAVNLLAMHMLDRTLLSIEKDPSRKRVGKSSDIPQRRFIMFQEDDIDDIQDIFYLWLVKITIVQGRFSK